MWIKSEDGKLFNLESAYSVQMEERQDSYIVVIEYFPAAMRAFNLTKRITREAAQRVINEIEAALESGVPLLNICVGEECEVDD